MSPNQLFKQLGVALTIYGGILIVAFRFSPRAGYIALGLVLLTAVPWLRRLAKFYKKSNTRRGRKLLDFGEAFQKCESERDPGDPGVLWGKLRIRTEEAKSHFCVVGAVGSGKTLTIRMLMQDQLRHIKKGSDRRAIVYDAKQDMVPILCSMGLQCQTVLLNPFDMRANAWNMAQDIDSPAAVRQLAVTLVPDTKESQPFFTNAVRELLAGVVTVFIKTRPGKWTFREVLLVMKSRVLLRAVLSQDAATSDVVNSILGAGENTVGSIMATVATKLGPYEPIAAAWEKAKGKISIQKWLRSESVLILGNDERIRSSLDAVNQLFVAVLAQHALTMPESDTRMTWFFFDEFREAGKLSGLESIVLRGRSKGCCVVLGFQDIQGVQHVYEEKAGNELVGQCANKALLRIESPETAAWASKVIGEEEKVEFSESSTESAQGRTVSHSSQKQTRSVVLPSEFMEIPAPGRNLVNGLQGYYVVRSVGVYRARYAAEELVEGLGKVNPAHQTFVAAPSEWQFLNPWTVEDSERLKIDVSSAQDPAKKNKGPSPLDDIERVEV